MAPSRTSGPTVRDRLDGDCAPFGSDIARQRLDDLDERCIAFVRGRLHAGRPVRALDIGPGFATVARHLASLGAELLLVERLPLAAHIHRGLDDAARARLSVLEQDLRDLRDEQLPATLEMLYSQRCLHYVPFPAVATLLARCAARLRASGGRAFLSFSGLESPLGADYPHGARPVEERFCPLAAPTARQHHITAPLCLYRRDDVAALAERAGMTLLRCWSSEFGNVKAVLEPR